MIYLKLLHRKYLFKFLIKTHCIDNDNRTIFIKSVKFKYIIDQTNTQYVNTLEYAGSKLNFIVVNMGTAEITLSMYLKLILDISGLEK